uniref:T9SS type A sorting domain-containing protein n=1 Tax=candidate division WOR-3 bacterium TaxID=2052148 RepID=A0A7C4XLT9_UNCW3
MKVKKMNLLLLFVIGFFLPGIILGAVSTAKWSVGVLKSQSKTIDEMQPLTITMRQEEFVDSFERSSLSPWTTYGYPGSVQMVTFGIRDTTNTYGPQAPAHSGYRYAGHPATDISLYPSPGQNPGNATCLESPTIDLTNWDSCFISFSYWGDFEGTATNFDGFIVEITTNNGTTWTQIDANHQGHLNPSYDAQLCGTGLLGYAWAYCYDTRPNWRDVASLNLMALGYCAPGNQIKIRFRFAYDALDGGQGLFIDDVRIASTPPQDLQPPAITHTPLIDTPDTLNDYVITANIVDQGSGVNPDSVTLHYLIEGGSWTEVVMTQTAPNVYEGSIPAQHYHTDIWYYIRAVDNAGNGINTLTYNFEVTNAITIFYDDGQPYWVPGGMNVGDGMFVQYNFDSVGLDSGILHQVKYFFSSPGRFELRVYSMSGGQPSQLVYSRPNLQSPGYAWYTEDITDANIHMSTDPVVGFIIGAPIGNDTVHCLMDPSLDHQLNMWLYMGGLWGNPIGEGGDFMIRLKVIPLPPYGIEEGSNNYPVTSLQLMPNPVGKDGAMIKYQLPDRQPVKLKVYDIAGKIVNTLVSGYQNSGFYTVNWNGCDEKGRKVADGVYFFSLETPHQTITRKAIVLK